MTWNDQIGFPILSVITFLPLAGVIAHAARRPRQAARSTRSSRWSSTLAAFALAIVMMFAFDTHAPRHAVRRERDVDQGAQHPLQLRRGRHRRAAALPHDVPRRDRHHRQLELRQGPRDGLLRLAAAAAGGHGRRVLRHRPLPLLRVLGGHARADVLHHRHLGRAAAHLRGHQVLPVHAGRQPAHAGRHHRGRVLRAGQHGRRPHLRHPGAQPPGLPVPPAVLGVPRLLRGLRHQGADVPAAHLAAGRARRGAHGRLGDPRRRPAEDGRLRHPALLPALLPGRRRHVHPLRGRAVGDRHRLRGAGLDGAEGPQEARRLLEREPHGLRDRRHLRGHRRRRQRRRHERRHPRDVQPRPAHRAPCSSWSATCTSARTRARSPT